MSSQQALNRMEKLEAQICGENTNAQQLQRQMTAGGLGEDPSFPQALTAAKFPEAKWDALGLESLLSPEEKAVRDRVRKFMEGTIAPVIVDYWEKAAFPYELAPKIGELGLCGGTIKGYGCPGISLMSACMGIIEIARVDCSLSTFVLVHAYMNMMTIYMHGTEQQKQEFLPKLAKCTNVGCWALTEPSNGSDASAIQSTAKRVPGGWVLNGQKRWIGNGTWADVSCVYAKNLETGQINCFLVRKGNPGLKTKKIENKIALRCVQNADMTFTDCFVPDCDYVPGCKSFKDTAKVLAVSRIIVTWQPVGACMGVYDIALRYVTQREQFGVPIASFQLIQERLSRMLATIQAMWLMAWKVTKLYDEGKLSHEQASLTKAWNTLRAREVCALGREVLGGNGILGDFNIAKAFVDVEAFYTYEGSYDINVLVAARGLTGVSAFKAAKKPAAKGMAGSKL